jgi:hypothetical protein
MVKHNRLTHPGMIHIRTTVCKDTKVHSVTCSNTDNRTLVRVIHGARVRITHITVIVRILYSTYVHYSGSGDLIVRCSFLCLQLYCLELSSPLPLPLPLTPPPPRIQHSCLQAGCASLHFPLLLFALVVYSSPAGTVTTV